MAGNILLGGVFSVVLVPEARSASISHRGRRYAWPKGGQLTLHHRRRPAAAGRESYSNGAVLNV